MKKLLSMLLCLTLILSLCLGCTSASAEGVKVALKSRIGGGHGKDTVNVVSQHISMGKLSALVYPVCFSLGTVKGCVLQYAFVML